MLPDRVSNPGPLTYESGALPIAMPGLKAQMTLQSLLTGKQDDNKASKKIRDQKKYKRTNSPYNDVSRLSPRSIQ